MRSDDSATAEAVAARLDTNPRATGLLMNALVAMGLLLKHQGVFRLTPAAETYLRSDAPHSLTGMIRFDAALWESWGRLPEAVRTGQPVRRPDMFQDDPQDTERFIRAMHSLVMARGDADIIVDFLELERRRAAAGHRLGARYVSHPLLPEASTLAGDHLRSAGDAGGDPAVRRCGAVSRPHRVGCR